MCARQPFARCQRVSSLNTEMQLSRRRLKRTTILPKRQVREKYLCKLVVLNVFLIPDIYWESILRNRKVLDSRLLEAAHLRTLTLADVIQFMERFEKISGQ